MTTTRPPSPAAAGDVVAELLAADRVATPAFVFDAARIEDDARRLGQWSDRAGCEVLYSVKALALRPVVDLLARRLDGLSASSLSEARLSRGVLSAMADGRPRTLQLTSPGLRDQEIDELATLADAVVLNSLSQWRRFAARVAPRAECGLRLNPGLSWLDDERYDPCRPHSKLGVPLADFATELSKRPEQFAGLLGLHFHTNYQATSTAPLKVTVDRIEATLGPLLRRIDWLNLGGGYQLVEMDEAQRAPLVETIEKLRSRHGLKVLIEPGSALVRRHGYLLATVVDRFSSGGRELAVLDTSVAHLAEVFEYQRPPRVAGHAPEGRFACTLAGCSCLAGDLFGEFRFAEPLAIGRRIVFCDVGAYALSKVQQFNGLAPPAVWQRTTQGLCEVP